MMSKNSDKAEFSMQNNEDEFPALGGANTPAGIGPPPGNLIPGAIIGPPNMNIGGIPNNQPKSAVSEFQEQQALQSRQGSDVTDLLGKSLRKQGVKSDLVNPGVGGNNNNLVDPLNMRRMDSQQQYYTNMGRPSPQNQDQRSQIIPPSQMSRQHIGSGNSNGNLGGPTHNNVGALSSQSSVTSSQQQQQSGGLVPNNQISSQSSVHNTGIPPPSSGDYSSLPPNRGPVQTEREHLNSPGIYVNQNSMHGMASQSVSASHNMSPMPNNNYPQTNLPEPDVYRHNHPDHLYAKQNLQGPTVPMNQPLPQNGNNNNGPSPYPGAPPVLPPPHVVSQHPINMGSPKNNGSSGKYNMDELLAKFQSDFKDGKLCLDPESYAWHNVPDGMLKSQFGMLSLMLSSTLSHKDRILTHGIDLDTLGIHNPSEDLQPPCSASDLFAGPFADGPNRWQDIPVPVEYAQHEVKYCEVNQNAGQMSFYQALRNSYGELGDGDLLAKVDPIRYNEDLLFWVYYNYPEDTLQMACGWALKKKNWRYHKHRLLWFIKDPDEEYRDCDNINTGEPGKIGRWITYNKYQTRNEQVFPKMELEVYESELCNFNMKPYYDYVVSKEYSAHHFRKEEKKLKAHLMQQHVGGAGGPPSHTGGPPQNMGRSIAYPY